LVPIPNYTCMSKSESMKLLNKSHSLVIWHVALLSIIHAPTDMAPKEV
jgi:hypothetical protein